MPRTPLRPIDGNIQRNKELTPYTRALICGRSDSGQRNSYISRAIGISPQTIAYTLKKRAERTRGESIKRAGRPRKLSEANIRYILRTIKKNPFITLRELQSECLLLEISISTRSLSRYIKESAYGHWKARERPQLTEEVAALRKAWALKHKDNTWEEWSKVIWSDECSVELGKGKDNLWVFHEYKLNVKWKKEYIRPKIKPKRVSIMIWGAIWGKGHQDLNIMTRDPESNARGYSSNSYLDILEDNLPSIWELGMIFMQDNAPIHTAKKITDWL
ncbi:Homeo [Trichophyton violaceum]|uniref:Homeo n=1 Tax=Trichophyton violaceum TaxID=34388 RepID=A0A178FS82_TRIVO|nr:Homeo [Trichophyton violaceum]